jgi:hypothetical protein
MGQADDLHTIYVSGFISQYVCPEGRFFLDFPDCRSVASDVKSLYELMCTFARDGYPTMFPHGFVPGVSFPHHHSLPGGSTCRFGHSI